MRVLCIDYGKKRCGLATTDPLQIIATALPVLETQQLLPFLKKYMETEMVERVLIGYPLNLDDSPTHATPLVEEFIRAFRKRFREVPIEQVDERYSSKDASAAISTMGLKKKQRERKGLIDEVTAVMLLQEWMQKRDEKN